ncbi:hypothetical protein D9757_012732 [Collybiopsis confluens]|uniref:Uncharacterized protein n=1 Tax=Collybiopsis confluens TaxID=2823264 RepID=A0A8H5FXQ0_9AGAR|nr:hypothetical protein D9757_012732 [Collybiopsis confluens]
MEKNHSRGWVIDGNYERRVGTIIHECATDVIWLDPPFLLYFPRLFMRTVMRIAGLIPQCSDGCEENVQAAFFSTDGIIWWCITNHRPCSKQNSAMMKTWGIGIGSGAQQKMRRLGGWGSELRTWLDSVREMARNA